MVERRIMLGEQEDIWKDDKADTSGNSIQFANEGILDISGPANVRAGLFYRLCKRYRYPSAETKNGAGYASDSD